MDSLATIMYHITESLLCPCTGACERVQDLTKSPFEMKRSQISLPSADKGMWRFSERVAHVKSPSLSMIFSYRSISWLKMVSCLPPPPLGLAPNPFPSDFWHPSSFCAVQYTHTGVKVNHSRLSTFFWIPPNSDSPTPRPRWQSCYKSVGTPAHVYGSDPLSTPQKEDTSQMLCRISVRSVQCDAAMTPSTDRLDFPLPGNPPRASRNFASSDSDLDWT